MANKLSEDALLKVSGGCDSDELYEKYDGFLLKDKVLVENAPPLPCSACRTTKAVVWNGTQNGKKVWICSACGTLHKI